MPLPGLSKRKKKDAGRADAHFSAPDKNWNSFLVHAKSKGFAKAVAADPRADSKLQRHVDQMNRLQTGRIVGHVGNYSIVRKRGGGLGCTCNDWRYKKSVAPDDEQQCKHIKQHREGGPVKEASLPMIGAALGAVAGSRRGASTRKDERKADYAANAMGAMSAKEMRRRSHVRTGRTLRDAALGGVAGGAAGHFLHTKGLPSLAKKYRASVDHMGNVAEDLGRRAAKGAAEGAAPHVDTAINRARSELRGALQDARTPTEDIIKQIRKEMAYGAEDVGAGIVQGARRALTPQFLRKAASGGKNASLRDVISGKSMRAAQEGAAKAKKDHALASDFLDHLKSKASRGGQSMGGMGSQAQRQTKRVKGLASLAGDAARKAHVEKAKTYGVRGAAVAVPVAGLYALKKRQDAKKGK